MRALAATAAVATALVLGCGAVEEPAGDAVPADASTDATDELRPAPPIEALDEPAPEEALDILSRPEPSAEDWRGGVGRSTCVRVGEQIETDGPCEEDQLEAILMEERGLMPAPDPAARAVARLRLADGGWLYFLEYRSRGAGWCPFFSTETPDGFLAGLSSGGLPCTEGGNEGFCQKLCLLPAGGLVSEQRVFLAGFVPSEGDELRIDFVDGTVARYPLTGPLLPNDESRRVFMVEETHGVAERLELLRDGVVIATEDVPPGVSLLDGGELPPNLEEELQGTPEVEFELDGQTLRVAIGAGAPPPARALLDEERVVFVCTGADDDLDGSDDLPPAHAIGRFPAGESEVTIELAAEVAGRLVFCGAGPEEDDEDPGAFQLFVPWEELESLYD